MLPLLILLIEGENDPPPIRVLNRGLRTRGEGRGEGRVVEGL